MAANGRTDRVSGRDFFVLEWIARWGVVPRGAVALRAQTGRSVTLARERRLRKAGLIEAEPFMGADTTLLTASRRGVSTISEIPIRPQRPSLGTVWHSIAMAYVAARLELAEHEVLSEHEILANQRLYGDREGSIEVPAANGRRAYHRPDMTALDDEGYEWAVEVELTAKAPGRLDELMRAWRTAVLLGKVNGVLYLCPPEVAEAVDKSIVRTMSGESIQLQVLDLPEAPSAPTYSQV